MGLKEDFHVTRLSSKTGKEFIRRHHYSRGSHNGPTCYGLVDNHSGEVVGVCAFATPCSEAVRSVVFGPDRKNEVTELHRLVVLDKVPRNGESFLISQALKILKQDRPQINAVLTYADTTQGHLGIIYQATNAIYTGSTGSRSLFYRDTEGRLRHPRQNGINITKEEAVARGWTPERRESKHRYVFLLANSKKHRRALRNELKVQEHIYPKER